MEKHEQPKPAESVPYRVERVFVGERTAEQVAADLMKVHTAA